jgi:hypothetical protein
MYRTGDKVALILRNKVDIVTITRETEKFVFVGSQQFRKERGNGYGNNYRIGKISEYYDYIRQEIAGEISWFAQSGYKKIVDDHQSRLKKLNEILEQEKDTK